MAADLVLQLQNQELRLKAGQCLIGIGGPAVKALIEGLASNDEEARRYARYALVCIGEPAKRELAKAFSDPRPSVAIESRKAMDLLIKKEFDAAKPEPAAPKVSAAPEKPNPPTPAVSGGLLLPQPFRVEIVVKHVYPEPKAPRPRAQVPKGALYPGLYPAIPGPYGAPAPYYGPYYGAPASYVAASVPGGLPASAYPGFIPASPPAMPGRMAPGMYLPVPSQRSPVEFVPNRPLIWVPAPGVL